MSQVRGYSPQFVQRLVKSPFVCVAYPQLGAGQREGYYDLHQTLPAPGNINGAQNLHHLAISVVAVKELARDQGWVPPEDAANLQATVDKLAQTVEELQDELDSAEAVIDSIDALESAGLRARRKAGRQKVKEAA